MRFKVIVPFLLAVVVGFLLGKFMFNQYDSKVNLKSVFNDNGEDVYFIQHGVYSSKESMEKNVIKLNSYIYEEKENKYYVYIGITKLSQNAQKLKDFFENKGYSIYIKQIKITNNSFLEALVSYDDLLSKTVDNKAIMEVCNQVLAKYKELDVSSV